SKDDPRNLWGFDMELPEYAYDFGELHNLSIGRGTLTDEERFHVNDHIVQTIIMLNSLPLPRHLRRLPEIAANHHEKLDGTGYPRHLSEQDLSIPARVVSIADVFEALTAGDRPYKKGKTLSESLGIMAEMVRDRHLDADLFELFLREGVHTAYATRFMPPAQISDVDIEHYLSLCRRDT
ncbi:MAG TPA: HD domain-containing phosphohydrolase, partial [Thioalkalivibrio sp.]|nr:HD domain-containing phosphohydrolase [Thioalkalivibrio sp.]